MKRADSHPFLGWHLEGYAEVKPIAVNAATEVGAVNASFGSWKRRASRIVTQAVG